MPTPLSLTFTPPETAPSPEDALILEQERWAWNTGVLTQLAFIRWLNAALYGRGTTEGLVNCGLDADGNIRIRIHIYPIRDVPFRLLTTIGTLSERQSEMIEEQHSLSYTLTDTASIPHPATRIIAARWLSGPYQTGGNKIAPPPLILEGQTVRTGLPVYGSVQVTVLVPRYTSTVTVPWESASARLQQGWSEWVAAYPPPYRPVALAITAPPGAQEMAESGLECGYHGRLRVNDPQDWPPSASPEDKHITCHYCELECDDDRANS